MSGTGEGRERRSGVMVSFSVAGVCCSGGGEWVKGLEDKVASASVFDHRISTTYTTQDDGTAGGVLKKFVFFFFYRYDYLFFHPYK